MAVTSGVFTILNQAGLITDNDIDLAYGIINKEQISAIAAISKVKSNLSRSRIMQILAQFYGLPLLDIAMFNLEFMPRNILTPDFMVENEVIPLAKRGKYLKLALADPTNKDLLAAIAFKTGLIIDPIVVDELQLQKVFKYNSTNYFKTINFDASVWDNAEVTSNLPLANSSVNSADDDQPVVKLVHKIILDAVQLGASDIHFEPYEQIYRIRYRIDGVLNEVAKPPPVLFKEKIAARIKVVAGLDIAEKRIPQDGRLRLLLSAKEVIDFRVNTLPTLYGEKIVLRILDRLSAMRGIDSLGLEAGQKRIIIDTINRPYGMFLVTGPTGSGKTITLYSCLNVLNDARKNISTVEDPIEIPLNGINQVAINEKVGLNFGVALRAFLRQDPDVIMVGEIRDADTAAMAVKASQTGHLVMSTLHTNDATSALVRLVSLGVPVYNVGDTILTIVAQRLVRKLCPQCKEPAKFAPESLILAGFSRELIDRGFQPYLPIGCNACYNSGYKGRSGIFEVVPISDALRRMIVANAPAVSLTAQARSEGILSLRQSGLEKVQQGITSLSEVAANTNE